MFAEEPEQDVLGPDIVMVEVACFLDRVLDDLLCTRGLGELTHRDHFWASADELLNFEADLAEVYIEVFEDIGPDAGAFLDEPEQDVLGPDVLVVEALGFLVGQGHHFAGSICKSFKHVQSPASRVLFPRCFRHRVGVFHCESTRRNASRCDSVRFYRAR